MYLAYNHFLMLLSSLFCIHSLIFCCQLTTKRMKVKRHVNLYSKNNLGNMEKDKTEFGQTKKCL